MEDIKIEEVIKNTKNIVEMLQTVEKLMEKDYVKSINYSNGCHIVKNSYTINTLIQEMNKGIEVFELQSLCEHKNTTGMIFTGNDSHYKYYNNTCNDCGFILETEQI